MFRACVEYFLVVRLICAFPWVPQQCCATPSLVANWLGYNISSINFDDASSARMPGAWQKHGDGEGLAFRTAHRTATIVVPLVICLQNGLLSAQTAKDIGSTSPHKTLFGVTAEDVGGF